MSWNDDDDLLPSTSRQEAFTRADKGKREELKRQIKAKLGTEKSAEVRREEARCKADFDRLRANLAGQQDEETKRKQRLDNEKKSSAPKTRTRKEHEEDAVETAQDAPDADTILERGLDDPETPTEETATEQ